MTHGILLVEGKKIPKLLTAWVAQLPNLGAVLYLQNPTLLESSAHPALPLFLRQALTGYHASLSLANNIHHDRNEVKTNRKTPGLHLFSDKELTRKGR